MWAADELLNLDLSLVQKYVPYPSNAQIIEDLIGNITLYPNVLPTTVKEQQLFLAISAAYYKQQGLTLKQSEFSLPEKIRAYATNTLQGCLTLVLSINIPKISIISGNDQLTVCVITILNPHSSILVDSGLSTKQRIDIHKPDLTVIPLSRPVQCIIHSYQGNSELPEDKPIDIPNTANILLINAFSPQNFITLPPATSKKKLNEWFKLSIFKSLEPKSSL